ncbi:MAG: Rho-binding antiterminator [Cellvibrionaceae bacterium]
MADNILPCDLHDYIEIACLYKIEVKLNLENNIGYTGIPITTGIDRTIGEYIEFLSNNDEKKIKIPLSCLESMQAIKPNPHFGKINFSKTKQPSN